MSKCLCGCGKETLVDKQYKTSNRYILGHATKGKHCIDTRKYAEAKRRMDKNEEYRKVHRKAMNRLGVVERLREVRIQNISKGIGIGIVFKDTYPEQIVEKELLECGYMFCKKLV